MPELTTFAVSDRANRQGPNNSQLMIINPRNVLVLPFIPTTFTFSITFGILGIPYGKDMNLDFKILSPSQKIVIKSDNITFSSVKNDLSLPEEGNGFVMNFELNNVAFYEEGLHKCVITLNGEVLGEKSIYIFNKQKHNGDAS